MQVIDKARDSIDFPQEMVNESLKFLETNYHHGIKHIVNESEFFDQLKPQARKELVFEVLKNHFD